VSKHEVIHVSHADSSCKMCEDEGVDFDMILQAQQANTCLQVNQHEPSDSDGSDEESVAKPEGNAHNQKKRRNKPKIKGLLNFSDSKDEGKEAYQFPRTMEEALTIEARAKIDDSDEEVEESIEQKVAARLPEARLPKGLLKFFDSEDKEGKAPISHAFARPRKGLGDLEESHEGGEGIVGEQEADTSGLAKRETDRCQQEFCSHEGAWKFSDSEDKAKDKQLAQMKTQESKVVTPSECKKAGIVAPPVEQARHPPHCKTRAKSLKPETSPKAPKASSPKPTSPKAAKASSPKQTTLKTHEIPHLGQSSPKKQENVATDAAHSTVAKTHSMFLDPATRCLRLQVQRRRVPKHLLLLNQLEVQRQLHRHHLSRRVPRQRLPQNQLRSKRTPRRSYLLKGSHNPQRLSNPMMERDLRSQKKRNH